MSLHVPLTQNEQLQMSSVKKTDGMPYLSYEPAHDKTCNKPCATSKDSDQPVYPHSMARVLIYPSLDSLDPVVQSVVSLRSS